MRLRSPVSRLAVATASLWAAQPGQAQTSIVADTATGRDLGTTVSTVANVTTIDNGTLAGTNLFHSFANFDLAAGDVAQWVYSAGDPASVTNVVNRVTGGSPSSIAGTIDSTALPNADFYFVNPAGIMFGAGAQVNVPAAAYFSTASELGFANGDVFSIATPNGSTLSIAAPHSFGFLGGEGDISMKDVENGVSSTFLPFGGGLVLAAANISLDNAFVGSNALVLAAVGDMAADVTFDGAADGSLDGAITLVNGSWLQTWPGGCFSACLGSVGYIQANAGTIDLTQSNIVADFDSPVALPPNSNNFVALNATRSFSATGSSVMSNGYDQARAGAITISAPDIALTDSVISTYTGGDGVGGSIVIGGSVLLLTASQISSESYGSGDAGEITIGMTGGIVLDAGSVVQTNANSTGAAGFIRLDASDLTVQNNSSISSTTAGFAPGGNIQLNVARDVILSSGASIKAEAGSGGGTTDGDAGQIEIFANRVTLSDATVSTSALDDGDAGFIAIVANDSLALDRSRVKSDSLGKGVSGAVLISADSATLVGGSRIASNAYGDGDGGQVFVDVAGALLMQDLSLIESNAGYASFGGGSGSFGKGGNVVVVAGSADLDNSYIRSSAFSDGDGGSIFVSVAGPLSLANFSGVNANSLGLGQAGSIAIQAGSATIADSIVRSTALGQGDGGAVGVSVAGALNLVNASVQSNAGDDSFASPIGIGSGGDVAVEADSLTMVNSSISSNAYADGDGGTVSVLVSGPILMIDESSISANSLGQGRAGDIFVGAGTMTITGLSTIATNARGSGDGGNVAVAVDGLLRMDQGAISTNAGDAAEGDQPSGDAGSIEIAAGTLDMRWSGIASSAYDSGNGGAVAIKVAGEMTMDGSYVSSDSTGTGDAGIIGIEAAQLTMRETSFVSSDAILDGDAGLVLVDVAGDILMSDLSRISSNVGESFLGQSTGDAGAIIINASNLVLDDAAIFSISFGSGDSGFVQIGLTGGLRMEGSSISSDARGETGDGGLVYVEAANAQLIDSSIASDTYADGDAGSVEVNIAGGLALFEGSYISSDTLGGLGNGGDVTVTARDILLDTESFVSSVAYADGDGGFVDVTATNSLTMTGEAAIAANVYGAGFGGAVSVTAPSITLSGASQIASTSGESATGDAGDVAITAGTLTMTDNSSIASDANGLGESGFVVIEAGRIALDGGATITTRSLNENPAGSIDITADDLRLSGLGTAIASENLNADPGVGNAAGSVFITAGHVVIAEGARVATNSLTGAAGNIFFEMPQGSLMILEGVTAPGVIETSSGPGTGGIIDISNPLAIISNGGRISALGQSGGANVQIDTNYFIVSSDRPNTVEVDGVLAFANAIYDVSAGTVDADLAMVDASGVLRNQCSAARDSGELSQLQLRPIGPFGSARPGEAEQGGPSGEPVGGCH